MRFTRADLIFALLALATLVSWWLGEGAAARGQHLGAAATLAVLALAACKGALIALDYMELRRALRYGGVRCLGWLAVVLALIAVFGVLL